MTPGEYRSSGTCRPGLGGLAERWEGEREGDLLGDRCRLRGLFTTVVMVSSLHGKGQEEVGTETHSLTWHPHYQHMQRPACEVRLVQQQVSVEMVKNKLLCMRLSPTSGNLSQRTKKPPTKHKASFGQDEALVYRPQNQS